MGARELGVKRQCWNKSCRRQEAGTGPDERKGSWQWSWPTRNRSGTGPVSARTWSLPRLDDGELSSDSLRGKEETSHG